MPEDPAMEVRRAPIHADTFRKCCGIGLLVLVVLYFAIEGGVVRGQWIPAVTFFGGIVLTIGVFSFISRKCECPNCKATIKRDKKLSPEGYFRYTCPTCRIIWQSQIRPGEPDN